MEFTVRKTALPEIESLRELFLSETKFQFVYNKCHGAGWSDVYVFTGNDMQIGYGSIWGKDRRQDRDTIFEFFLVNPFRKYASSIFYEFIKTSGALFIESQSNDLLLTQMLYQYAADINAEAILFEDAFETNLAAPGVSFTKKQADDGDQQYCLEKDGNVLASGGYVWNYNFPYIDMYYEVREAYRRQGYGSLITQELKREAYRLSRVPSARCNIKNNASRSTLLKAGMRMCGNILVGKIMMDRP